jgi:1-deoxy-D-xylulose-5-phosphate reductoisomerase
MQIPISYALHYPTRAVLDEFNQFDLAEVGKLSFDKPDKTRFRSLKILDSLLYSIDSNASLVFNVANEVAVAAFLNDQISFIQITEIIEKVLNHIESKKLDDIEEVIEQIALVKQIAEEKITWI